jgi:hypothetical protein
MRRAEGELGLAPRSAGSVSTGKTQDHVRLYVNHPNLLPFSRHTGCWELSPGCCFSESQSSARQGTKAYLILSVISGSMKRGVHGNQKGLQSSSSGSPYFLSGLSSYLGPLCHLQPVKPNPPFMLHSQVHGF